MEFAGIDSVIFDKNEKEKIWNTHLHNFKFNGQFYMQLLLSKNVE